MANIRFTAIIIFLAFGKKNNSGSAWARTGDLRITSPHLYHRAIGEAVVRRQKSKYINIFPYIYEVCLLFKLGVHSLQFTVDRLSRQSFSRSVGAKSFFLKSVGEAAPMLTRPQITICNLVCIPISSSNALQVH